MQPVNALSGVRSSPLTRVTVSSAEVDQTDAIVKKIPIVEPMPHYPLSATVSEIMAHITELIKEQRAASQEIMHQKNLDAARAEMERMFDAAIGKSDGKAGGRGTDGTNVFAVDTSDIVDKTGIRIDGKSKDKSATFDRSADIESGQQTTAQKTQGNDAIDKSARDVQMTSKNDGKLPPLPSDIKYANKKDTTSKGIETPKTEVSSQKDSVQQKYTVDIADNANRQLVNK